MIKYLLGLLKFLFHPGVSLFCKIDNRSEVDKKARINSNTQVFNSTIGKYSYLGRYSYLICAKIGNFCSIGDEVKVECIHVDMANREIFFNIIDDEKSDVEEGEEDGIQIK